MYSKSTSALALTEPAYSKQTLPDLSHLSESERQIIASVLERQRAEEFTDTNVDNKFNRFDFFLFLLLIFTSLLFFLSLLQQ